MTLFALMLIAALAFGGSFECRSDHDRDHDDDDDGIVVISMAGVEIWPRMNADARGSEKRRAAHESARMRTNYNYGSDHHSCRFVGNPSLP
jgi:hypothetical protein